MVANESKLDLALPSEALALGDLLSAKLPSRRSPPRQVGTPQPDASETETLVDGLLAKVRKEPSSRRILGTTRCEAPALRMRLKAVAILAWQSLRLSVDVMDIGDLATAMADPTLPPTESLLRCRHEIGRMMIEESLISRGEADGFCDKVKLPFRTLEWFGGKSSLACLTTNKLVSMMLPKGIEDDPSPSKNTPIPSAKDLQARISELVLGVDQVVMALSSRLVMHVSRTKLLLAKQDSGTGNQAILLIGSSGCGKTFLMSEAAKVINFPFSSISSPCLTSEGYVGGKLDDLFRGLMTQAKGDGQAARFGIAFADEWDKKAARHSVGSGRDVSTTSIQQEFLVPMQGAQFLIAGKRGMERPLMFNSQGTFFTFAGAFDGLAEIIRRKTSKSCIGFSAETKTKHQDYVLDAIRDYGYIREWVNRLTAVMFLPDPTMDSLKTAAAGGVLASFNTLVGQLGIVLFPHGQAIPRMADYALESKTYYRGLKSVWWSIAEQAVASGEKGMVIIGSAEVDAAIGRVASGSAAGLSVGTGKPEESPAVHAVEDGMGDLTGERGLVE